MRFLEVRSLPAFAALAEWEAAGDRERANPAKNIHPLGSLLPVLAATDSEKAKSDSVCCNS